MNVLYLFDVDGVLCDAGCKIDPEFKTFFLEWAVDKQYYLITGGERKSTIDQIGIEIVENAEVGFHCMGNQIFMEGNEYKINQVQLNDSEREWLETYAATSSHQYNSGNYIEQRSGSINYSVIGKNASIEQKKEYFAWDAIHNERKFLIKEIARLFPRLEAFIGGNASIDICLRGANKGGCVDLLYQASNYIKFFGDRCFPDGIDYPIVVLLRNDMLSPAIYSITTGYKETWENLKIL